MSTPVRISSTKLGVKVTVKTTTTRKIVRR